jgi:formylglycine-generating enzyme required for sulfatase activity
VAHRKGLVHRDVKPGNILIDREGKAWLTDFGLALREENFGKGPKYVGTPAYMSPEQARGEEHRVDGRSDIFSLGAVFYELLTGRLPYRAATQTELLQKIITSTPRPPRQYNEYIPKELERICLKALSRRANDRYVTAHDMAEDLKLFLAESTRARTSISGGLVGSGSAVLGSAAFRSEATSSSRLPSGSVPAASVASSPGSGSHPLKIVPRGLSSFDEHDSDFFVDLLPGPRDRSGLPDSIRFWQTRIQETDAEKAFSVGLIYGPSGCGKSSMVKAALLPRLAPHVKSIYVEATGTDTEQRLLRRMRAVIPGLSSDLSLSETLASLRKEILDGTGHKLLIVLDQFEQWLHAHSDQNQNELEKALRQCDGVHVQCLVMVRDDFWLAVSRFMLDLEIDIVSGRNVALVDLFSPEHARAVLAAFGRAFGRLPETMGEISREQNEFLDQAVSGLAEEGRVVPVRLSIFAEMMKNKPWTPAALKQIGGAAGIGVMFLEEAFSATTAIPKHRMHAAAARRVLEALLPEAGSDIKGSMRSSEELLVVSGYAGLPKEFADLMHLLDSELRLITPTDPEGDSFPGERQGVSPPSTQSLAPRLPPTSRCFQLTHDYLVPSLRDWLTQKQSETRRGRAEQLLAERFAMWNRKSENRNLPSAWEWLKIRLLMDPRRQTPAQRLMLRRARQVHGLRWGIGVVVTVVIGIATMQWVRSVRHSNLVDRMHTAVDTVANSNGAVVQLAMENLNVYPKDLIISHLETQFEKSNGSQKLALAYALASYGIVDIDFLVSSIGTASSVEVNNLADALAQSQTDSVAALRQAAEACELDKDWNRKQRLAVVALQLGETSIAIDMCQLRSDRIERLDFILAWPAWHGDLARLAQFSGLLNDPALRSGLLVGLGKVHPEDVTRDIQQAWQPILADWFQQADEAAVHNAAEWLLRRWELEVPAIDAAHDSHEDREWQVTETGMSLVRIPAGTFQRRYGYLARRPEAPDFLSAPLQTVTLSRPMLVSDREVSARQFQQMIDDKNYDDREKVMHWTGIDPISSPTPDHPAQHLSWIDAVRFCNWLSHTEGLVPAYERTGRVWRIPPDGTTPGDFEEWRLVDGASGYRLPTIAEWEYVCRAGCNTQNPFGDEVNSRFLQVFASSRTRVVVLDSREYNAEKCGTEPPNAWGLFDLHGNVAEWCQDWAGGYPGTEMSGVDAVTDPTGPVENDPLLFKQMRDGIFYHASTALTVGGRLRGFRVVRTLE